ncbi:tetratricopeptide repeat-containing sensor histidine kinase [Winogradskyella flava]|uniref:tetratricopeptide repeat-containing sensor histidine kinase n=1 Tax=Winogradskyella flava TaxID=1884876 RepID=UPI002491434F|nr:tetratricopeptide repeat-containing sensor histidine kinase [Winogradskyella flava]
MYRYLILLYFIFFVRETSYSQRVFIDSINKLVSKSESEDFSLQERLDFALQSSELAKETKVDSVILRVNRNLSMRYFQSQDFENYIAVNRRNFDLAKQLNDSSAVTVAGSNLGTIYRYFEKKDSAYYYYSQELKFYPQEDLQEDISEYKATALFYIAEILQVEKIYAGAEEAAVKSIKLLNGLPETEDRLELLWNAYNLMGIILRELGDYNESLEYYDKSNAYAKKIEDGFLNEVYSINNKAYVYRQMGDFDKAIELYSSLLPLRSKYDEEDPAFYPTILTNIADTELESGFYDPRLLINKFRESYDLTKELDDEVLRMNVALDLSKFYLELKKSDSIFKYANEAYKISSKVSANEVRQEALLILSRVTEGEKGKAYLREHIRLTDSLINEQRTVRNKFARIEFDTDQIEAENKQISKENLYLAILSIGLLLTAILIYVVISQRAKNRKLKLIQVQQKANEDIYNLMLGQQDKVDEARTLEKKRISEELHDGVLGRLFGTRLSLDSMNFKDGKDAMMTRANYIGQLKTIEEDIRKISHELNTDFVSGTGFMDIVSELIDNQTQAYGLKSDFEYTDDISWDLVSNKTKINIYRIIQESMQNIYKHANAKAIKISISLEKYVICLDIIDDGEGFDTSKSRKGIGLKNMTSRVEDIDGEITFTSQSGNGTTVNVKIPYTNQST